MKIKTLLLFLFFLFFVLSCIGVSEKYKSQEKEAPKHYDYKMSGLRPDVSHTGYIYLLEYDNKKFLIFYDGNNSCMSQIIEQKGE